MSKSFFDNLLRFVRRVTRDCLRIAFYYPLDQIELLLGKRDRTTPPRWLVSTGGTGNNPKIAQELSERIIANTDLQPQHRVLDIGCGIGKLANPLTRHLSGEGRYEGIDIQARAIRWLNKNITREHANFRFQWMDVYSELYNRRGAVPDFEYEFPYPDETFDLIVLISVFSHMLLPGTSRYLDEIQRLLKPSGLCYATFFLLNESNLEQVRLGNTTRKFPHMEENYATSSKLVPEEVVAYKEEWLMEQLSVKGLALRRPVDYGDLVHTAHGQSTLVFGRDRVS